jgi:hypothetical protein
MEAQTGTEVQLCKVNMNKSLSYLWFNSFLTKSYSLISFSIVGMH